jgi:hypothetical protein
MKHTKSLLVLAFVLAPGVAAAQGYYGNGGGGYGGGGGYYSQPPATQLPGGFHNRQGRLIFGGSLGLGGMHDSGSNVTTCNNCDYNPIAVELDGHIGGFVMPRLALMAEGQINAQTVAVDPAYGDDTVISMNTLMIAAQYWVTPQLWIKGGLGVAQLYANNSYDGWDFGTGGAIMGGLGYELMSARNFAVDLQGRLIQGSFNSLNDNVTSGTVGVGINWY